MTLDPRNLPRSYPEMLQDIIGIHAKLSSLDSTDAKYMALMVEPAAALAEAYLAKLTDNAVRRMIGGGHG